MKHISPVLASIALLASLGAVAQTTPRVRMFIPTTPGVRVMSQAETARAKAKTDDTVKKTLITKMEMTSDNGRREYCNVTYNERGHFKTLDLSLIHI